MDQSSGGKLCAKRHIAGPGEAAPEMAAGHLLD
jgi:hypothetical protein